MSYSFAVQIAGIIQHTSTEVLCYDISYKTFAESQAIASDKTVIVLSIISSQDTVHQFIDLNKLINQYDRYPASWDDIIALYTAHRNDRSWSNVFTYTEVPAMQDYIIGEKHYRRQTPFVSNMKDYVTTFSLDHHNYVTGSYLSKRAPYIRNIQSRIRTMPDLVFTKTSKGDVDFSNIIASIDGNVGYPEYDETTDELYVKNGAYFLRGTNGPDQNIVFMDFSGLVKSGKSLIHKYFHECAPELVVGEGDSVEIYNGNLGAKETLLSRNTAWWKQAKISIKFSVLLPDTEVSTNLDYIPLVCFGGRLFFPGLDDLTYRQSIHTSDDKTKKYVNITLKLDLDLLSRIVASNLQHAGIFMGNSSFYQVAVTYALSNIFTANASNIPTSTEEWRAIAYLCKADIPFVSIIPTDKSPISVTRTEPLMSLHDGEILFPAKSKGILVMKQTKEIMDYTPHTYATSVMVETAPRKALYLSTRGQAVVHMNRTKGPVTEVQGSADIESIFPKNATISYSALDGDCYVVRSHDGAIIAKSSVTTQAVPYTDSGLVWTIYETKIEIPDSMRYHDIVSETRSNLVIDGRNRHPTGINIRNINECYLMNILFAGANSTIAEESSAVVDDNKNPERPVHTIEYMQITDPIKKGTTKS